MGNVVGGACTRMRGAFPVIGGVYTTANQDEVQAPVISTVKERWLVELILQWVEPLF